MRLIDTHTHLAMGDFKGKVWEVLEHSRQAKVEIWITMGTNLEDNRAGIQLAAEHEGLYGAVGIHPHEADKAEAGYIEELARMAAKPKVQAMGEIGLDYHYEFSPRKRQQEVFAEQLELAHKLSLPVVIHCREAWEDSLGIMEEIGRPTDMAVFHCFTGNRQELKILLDRGYYISLTGVVTYKNAQALQEAVRYVPLSRVMLETDCPYLSPEPKRSIRPNEPALLVYIAEKLARLRQVSLEEIAQATTANACAFFRLKEKDDIIKPVNQ